MFIAAHTSTERPSTAAVGRWMSAMADDTSFQVKSSFILRILSCELYNKDASSGRRMFGCWWAFFFLKGSTSNPFRVFCLKDYAWTHL